jgi:hypothetical protein
MSGPRVLTKAEIVASVPSRWARQYAGTHDDKHSAITAALWALNPGFTATEADAIIGNASWTRLECGICEQDAPAVVVFDRYDECSVRVCANCFGHAAKLLAPSHGREGTE